LRYPESIECLFAIQLAESGTKCLQKSSGEGAEG